MGKFISMEGQRFRHLQVLHRTDDLIYPSGRPKVQWLCRCDCGREVPVQGAELRKGVRGSCGCRARQIAGEACSTHGHTRNKEVSPEYRSWYSAMQRCNNPNNPQYNGYGGRGIKFCERWSKFTNFLADMGLKPSPKHSIDRYPNKDGNYEPGNVRWATASEQQRNKRKMRAIGNFSDDELRQEWTRRGLTV